MIGSVAVRLHWLGAGRGDRAAGDAGLAIERAVARVLAGPTRTRDLDGTASTAEFTAALLRHLDA